MHAEPAAMQTIVEALEPLTQPQRQAVGKALNLPTSDGEVQAMLKALVALKDVQGAQARTRVIRWAMDAYKAPTKQARKPHKAEEPKAKPVERDRTIDLRPAASA